MSFQRPTTAINSSNATTPPPPPVWPIVQILEASKPDASHYAVAYNFCDSELFLCQASIEGLTDESRQWLNFAEQGLHITYR